MKLNHDLVTTMARSVNCSMENANLQNQNIYRHGSFPGDREGKKKKKKNPTILIGTREGKNM